MKPHSSTSIASRAGYTVAAIYLGCAALAGAIFFLDLQVPRGLAIGSLYIVVVLFALWAPNGRFILVAALVCSLLILLSLPFKAPLETFGATAINRGVALATVWITAFMELRIKQVEQQLIRIASQDFLTGLLNRREIFNRLHTEICRVDRIDRSLSILMIDIDHFKRINDSYGHVTGDRVLKEVAALLRAHVREYDYLGRYGGEEFLVAAPETPAQVARELAERLRREVNKAPLSFAPHQAIPVTISVGVTQHRKGESVESALSRADRGLYHAKEEGRNRVVAL